MKICIYKLSMSAFPSLPAAMASVKDGCGELTVYLPEYAEELNRLFNEPITDEKSGETLTPWSPQAIRQLAASHLPRGLQARIVDDNVPCPECLEARLPQKFTIATWLSEVLQKVDDAMWRTRHGKYDESTEDRPFEGRIEIFGATFLSGLGLRGPLLALVEVEAGNVRFQFYERRWASFAFWSLFPMALATFALPPRQAIDEIVAEGRSTVQTRLAADRMVFVEGGTSPQGVSLDGVTRLQAWSIQAIQSVLRDEISQARLYGRITAKR